jgi:hypothetical protein
MEIQLISDGRLMIYLTGEDVKKLPAAPSEITTTDAAEILRNALGPTYDTSWDSVCFELYPGRDSLLMFALQHSGIPSFFMFPDCEGLISAAQACPPGLISYLTYADENYILIVYPWNGERPPYVLFEYGTELIRPASYALHLSEHSNVIAGPNAMDMMRNAF